MMSLCPIQLRVSYTVCNVSPVALDGSSVPHSFGISFFPLKAQQVNHFEEIYYADIKLPVFWLSLHTSPLSGLRFVDGSDFYVQTECTA